MQVQIRNVSVEWVGQGNRKYGKATVEYAHNGEARKQNVMSFTNPDVFKKVQELQGQFVEVEVGKNDKGYSEWRSVASVAATNSGSSVNGAPGVTRVSGSNYETKEERVARQWMIAKQSSLDRAVQVLTHNAPKDKVDPQAAIELAGTFFDYVTEGYDTKTNTLKLDLSIEDMDNDLPF